VQSSCLNCGYEGTGHYCPACGQKVLGPGIRFKQVWSEFFSYNFSIEGPVWKTIHQLAVDPGMLLKAFIGGKRKTYYKPVQFFLVASLIYFALVEWLEFDPLQGQFETDHPEHMKPWMDRIQRSSQFMVKNINNFLFLLVLGIGCWLKVFHRRAYAFAEYITMGFYLTGFYILVGTFDLLFWKFDADARWFKVLFFCIYFTYAYGSLFKERAWTKYFKGFLIAVLSFASYFVLAFGLSFVLISMF
jgi:hypothetical protein